MDVSLILRVAGIGLLVALCAQLLSKNGREEQATFVTVAGVVAVALLLVGEIASLLSSLRNTFGI